MLKTQVSALKECFPAQTFHLVVICIGSSIYLAVKCISYIMRNAFSPGAMYATG